MDKTGLPWRDEPGPEPVTLSKRYVARLLSRGLRIQSLQHDKPIHLVLTWAEVYMLSNLLYDNLDTIMKAYQGNE